LGKWKLYTFRDIIDCYQEKGELKTLPCGKPFPSVRGGGNYILDSDHERSVVKEAL